MKQFIVFISMLVLGCVIFELVAGDENSIYTEVKGIWRNELESSRVYP